MKHRSPIYMSRLQGATLIEVLAGLTILGSVTVALLLARGRLLEQQALATRKIEGVKIADNLLAGWYAEGSGVPVNTKGEITDHPGWSWQTQRLDTDTQPFANTDVMRLKLYNEEQSLATNFPVAPIVMVDLLVSGDAP